MGQSVEGQTSHDAFGTYVLTEVEVLLQVARAVTGHSADAEDLVQDTLARAYRSIDRFDGRHPRAWLLTILRKTDINRSRHRRLEVAPEGEAERVPAPAGDEPEAVMAGSFDAAVERALFALPDRFRCVVELVDLCGLSYQEAAVSLDVPVGTVLIRLHRGRSRIKASLGAAGTVQRKGGRRLMRWRRARRDELRCKEVGRILQRCLDGELDDLRTRQVARHLADCLRCGMAADTYNQIKQALRRSGGPLPEGAVERLRAFGEELAARDADDGEKTTGA